MGDENDRGAPTFGLRDRLDQALLAVGVEAGVGLVENEEPRLTVQRARQAEALTLAAGQEGAAVADLGLVAVRQAQNDVVHARRHRGLDDRAASASDESACPSAPAAA